MKINIRGSLTGNDRKFRVVSSPGQVQVVVIFDNPELVVESPSGSGYGDILSVKGARELASAIMLACEKASK